MRTNAPSYGKRTPFTRAAFADFARAYSGGIDLSELSDSYDGTIDHAQRATVADARWSCLTREQIAQKNDSLDLGLIADESHANGSNDEEPLDIAREVADELKTMQLELTKMIELLG